MKILVVDNGSKYIKLLLEILKRNEVDVVDYEHIPKLEKKDVQAIVLSGGNQHAAVNTFGHYNKEIELIKNTDIPILGICLGFQLIAHTFGGSLKKLENRSHGVLELQVLLDDAIFDGIEELKVFESHRWVVVDHPHPLFVLARSKDGVEIIKHTEKLIYGFQFHPEVFVEGGSGEQIIHNFLKLAGSKPQV